MPVPENDFENTSLRVMDANGKSIGIAIVPRKGTLDAARALLRTTTLDPTGPTAHVRRLFDGEALILGEQDIQTASAYKWYRIEYTDAPALELTDAEQERLLAIIREAGERDQYEVEIPLDGRLEHFVQAMLWGQQLDRLTTLLCTAFGGEGREVFKKHNLSQVQPPYRLIVYNQESR